MSVCDHDLLPLLHEVLEKTAAGLDANQVSPDASLVNELELDSLTLASFATALDEVLGPVIGLDEWLLEAGRTSTDTLQNLAAWLESRDG